MADFDDFRKLDIRAGEIIQVEEFPRARNPSFKVRVDFGAEVGIKQTSAQITKVYQPDQLLGKKVLGIINLGSKNIAGFISEFLLLGLADNKGHIHLLTHDGEGLKGATVS